MLTTTEHFINPVMLTTISSVYIKLINVKKISSLSLNFSDKYSFPAILVFLNFYE